MSKVVSARPPDFHGPVDIVDQDRRIKAYRDLVQRTAFSLSAQGYRDGIIWMDKRVFGDLLFLMDYVHDTARGRDYFQLHGIEVSVMQHEIEEGVVLRIEPR